MPAVAAGEQRLCAGAGPLPHQRFLQGQPTQPDLRGREPSWARGEDGAIGH